MVATDERMTIIKSDFRQMLFVCGTPPSNVGGGPVIFKNLLKGYKPDRLNILCCGGWRSVWLPKAESTMLSCQHTFIPKLNFGNLRPARFFSPLIASLNCARISLIRQAARRIIKERGVEVIFTATSDCEFNLAAYFVHRETGLPLYYFETDDWEMANSGLSRWLVRRYRPSLFRLATKLWLISPAMVREYESRLGVRGEFLFNFLDVEPYELASQQYTPPDAPAPIELVYTGSINLMFLSTMRMLCRHLNGGLSVAGRPVRLTIYGSSRPMELLGPAVTYAGLVSHAEIPAILARAHANLIAISFDRDPNFLSFIKTNIYTKTLDYLASGRPVLLVAPKYTAEVEYFSDVAYVVPTLEREMFAAAIARLVNDPDYVAKLGRRGQEFVRERHGTDALERQFLRHFRVD